MKKKESDMMLSLPEIMQILFVKRLDCYALAHLSSVGKMAYTTKNELITEKLIEEHVKGKKTIGVYQLKGDAVYWGVLDFDKNTPSDFQNAKKIFSELKKEGLHPL